MEPVVLVESWFIGLEDVDVVHGVLLDWCAADELVACLVDSEALVLVACPFMLVVDAELDVVVQSADEVVVVALV